MSTTERPVPVWAYRLAHAIPFLTLPSGLWRLGLVFGSSMGVLDASGNPARLDTLGGKVYVVCLSIFSELVALTVEFLQEAHSLKLDFSPRDGIILLRFAI